MGSVVALVAVPEIPLESQNNWKRLTLAAITVETFEGFFFFLNIYYASVHSIHKLFYRLNFLSN